MMYVALIGDIIESKKNTRSSAGATEIVAINERVESAISEIFSFSLYSHSWR